MKKATIYNCRNDIYIGHETKYILHGKESYDRKR